MAPVVSGSLLRRAAVALALLSATAGAQSTRPLTPAYSFEFFDDVTGGNCTGTTTLAGGCNGGGWFVSPGADVYASDVYERPTSQTYAVRSGSTAPVATEYLGYLDLVSARYGYDSRYMYFQLNTYSRFLYKNDGTMDGGAFGSGTYYGVQLGTVNANDGQLLLRAEQTASTLGTSSGSFSAAKTQGWFDQNNSVSGPGGIGTPNEEGIIPVFNGYERSVISTDGYLPSNSSSHVLFSRSFVNSAGRATIELALDYLAFNGFCAAQSLGCSVTPASLPYLVFEATRGLKDQQNYVWNDKYSAAEAGTPYSTSGLGNIYELDNMRASVTTVVAEPETFGLALVGMAGLGLTSVRRRRARGKAND